MKVFGGNYDGRREGVIAARSQKEAAKFVGVSLYHFRLYWCETGNEEDIAQALTEPGTLFIRRMLSRDDWERKT